MVNCADEIGSKERRLDIRRPLPMASGKLHGREVPVSKVERSSMHLCLQVLSPLLRNEVGEQDLVYVHLSGFLIKNNVSGAMQVLVRPFQNMQQHDLLLSNLRRVTHNSAFDESSHGTLSQCNSCFCKRQIAFALSEG